MENYNHELTEDRLKHFKKKERTPNKIVLFLARIFLYCGIVGFVYLVYMLLKTYNVIK